MPPPDKHTSADSLAAVMRDGDVLLFCSEAPLSRLVRSLDAPWRPVGKANANHVGMWVGDEVAMANRRVAGLDQIVQLVREDLGWIRRHRIKPSIEAHPLAGLLAAGGPVRHILVMRPITPGSGVAAAAALDEQRRRPVAEQVRFSVASLTAIALQLISRREESEVLAIGPAATLFLERTTALLRTLGFEPTASDGPRFAFCSEFVFNCFAAAGNPLEIVDASESGSTISGQPSHHWAAGSLAERLAAVDPPAAAVVGSPPPKRPARPSGRVPLKRLREATRLADGVAASFFELLHVTCRMSAGGQAGALGEPTAADRDRLWRAAEDFDALLRGRFGLAAGSAMHLLRAGASAPSGDFVTPNDLLRSPSLRPVAYWSREPAPPCGGIDCCPPPGPVATRRWHQNLRDLLRRALGWLLRRIPGMPDTWIPTPRPPVDPPAVDPAPCCSVPPPEWDYHRPSG